MLEQLTANDCWLLILGAAGIGFSKSGFAGVSMLHVIVFASVFGAKDSTGVLLPMLVIGDLFAICLFGKTVQWKYVGRLLPPTLVGVVIGTFLMDRIDENLFKPLVGLIILSLSAVQAFRTWKPDAFEHIPHSKAFAWSLGLMAGITSMLANAAGPVVALYLMAVALPKLEFVGTSAWLFLVVNIFKLPFSFSLGLIDQGTLSIDLLFAPAILVGMLLGKWSVKRIPQMQFDILLLAFTAIAAARLVFN